MFFPQKQSQNKNQIQKRTQEPPKQNTKPNHNKKKDRRESGVTDKISTADLPMPTHVYVKLPGEEEKQILLSEFETMTRTQWCVGLYKRNNLITYEKKTEKKIIDDIKELHDSIRFEFRAEFGCGWIVVARKDIPADKVISVFGGELLEKSNPDDLYETCIADQYPIDNKPMSILVVNHRIAITQKFYRSTIGYAPSLPNELDFHANFYDVDFLLKNGVVISNLETKLNSLCLSRSDLPVMQTVRLIESGCPIGYDYSTIFLGMVEMPGFIEKVHDYDLLIKELLFCHTKKGLTTINAIIFRKQIDVQKAKKNLPMKTALITNILDAYNAGNLGFEKLLLMIMPALIISNIGDLSALSKNVLQEIGLMLDLQMIAAFIAEMRNDEENYADCLNLFNDFFGEKSSIYIKASGFLRVLAYLSVKENICRNLELDGKKLDICYEKFPNEIRIRGVGLNDICEICKKVRGLNNDVYDSAHTSLTRPEKGNEGSGYWFSINVEKLFLGGKININQLADELKKAANVDVNVEKEFEGLPPLEKVSFAM